MPKQIKIIVDETEETASLDGIPAEAWDRFKAAAKKQFPTHGDDAWAAFLSEVIVAGSGGTGETVSYFMTDVPLGHAEAIHKLLQQIGWTWDKFHAYLLRTAVIPGQLRLISFAGEDMSMGAFIATGLKAETFAAIEKATGRSFEQVMGTIFAAAAAGTITFAPETTYLEPKTI